jgi:hypothetical protein
VQYDYQKLSQLNCNNLDQTNADLYDVLCTELEYWMTVARMFHSKPSVNKEDNSQVFIKLLTIDAVSEIMQTRDEVSKLYSKLGLNRGSLHHRTNINWHSVIYAVIES